MRNTRKTRTMLCLLGGFGLLWATDAFAYIDPGSGSLLLQIVIAGAVGLIYRVRGVFQTILQKIRSVWK